MHEAYILSPLIKLNHQIECLSAYGKLETFNLYQLYVYILFSIPGNNLLVGTKQGHLFMYELVKTDENLEVQLMRYNKSFSKRPIQQLEVVPDNNLLISLTGKCLFHLLNR